MSEEERNKMNYSTEPWRLITAISGTFALVTTPIAIAADQVCGLVQLTINNHNFGLGLKQPPISAAYAAHCFKQLFHTTKKVGK